MYNTPSTYAIYMSGLVFRWLLTQGGVKKIEAINNIKAQTLYDTIDGSGGFYVNRIRPDARSKMNVVFKPPPPNSTAASSSKPNCKACACSKATKPSAACAPASTTPCRSKAYRLWQTL